MCHLKASACFHQAPSVGYLLLALIVPGFGSLQHVSAAAIVMLDLHMLLSFFGSGIKSHLLLLPP